MIIPSPYIYLIYAGILGVIMVLVVPKEKIHELTPLAILFGAMVNVALIFLISNILNIGGHKNYGPFGIMGVSFFAPIAWTIYFIMFLYFLPKKKPWNYLFTFTASVYAVFFANVLSNLDVFYSNQGRFIVPFIIYGCWHFGVMYIYQKYFQHNNKYIN